MGKDTKRLVRALQAQGFEVTRTRSNHYAVRKDGQWVETLPSTPSDHRSFLNALAKLRRAGFVWKGR